MFSWCYRHRLFGCPNSRGENNHVRLVLSASEQRLQRLRRRKNALGTKRWNGTNDRWLIAWSAWVEWLPQFKVPCRKMNQLFSDTEHKSINKWRVSDGWKWRWVIAKWRWRDNTTPLLSPSLYHFYHQIDWRNENMNNILSQTSQKHSNIHLTDDYFDKIEWTPILSSLHSSSNHAP